MSRSDDIKISITDLADFSCRHGDLLPAGVASPSAREGMRAHKVLQEQRKKTAGHPDWLFSELRISCSTQSAGLTIKLGGRIDLADTQNHILSEIKTTLVPSDKLPEAQRAVQWAQLYLYGYVYLQSIEEKRPEALNLVLIHVNIRGVTTNSETRVVSSVELMEHAQAAILCYAQWINKIQDWHQRLIESADTLKFPFEKFRQGQRDMAAAIYRASRDAKLLMCEAPTGIGKTISSLYPAIKSMGEGTVKQVVYLTAKVGGRLSAEEALRGLRVGGLAVSSIQIRAKQATCFCSNGRCERDDSGRCPMTLGFFDRLPQARDELLAIGAIDNEMLDEIAWSHQLCPFELVLQMLPWVQVIVTDFNYVFDPLVKLGHFANDCKGILLLVDEAHNLLDRSRSMYSAELSREHCMEAANECRQKFPLITREIEGLSRRLLEHSRIADQGENVSMESPEALLRSASAVLEQINAAMAEPAVVGEITSELWRALCRYVVIHELFSTHHRCIVDSSKSGRRRQVVVKLYCLDASMALSSSYQLFRSVIMFSATLRPGTFYRDTLGLAVDTGYLQLPSPFDPDNCLRAIVDWIDTRYRYRQSSMDSLVALIEKATAGRAGNYLVFFPSYAYLEQVHTRFSSLFPQRSTWTQSRGQSRQEQQRQIDELDTPGHRIGFAIQGGVFGEGIDYKGERLIGTLIVGTGLPAADEQSELIAEHYRESGHDGYDFTFRYPGFTRVLQTAGRVIRGETDKGFVLLVDPRFTKKTYQELFPDDWQLQCPDDEDALLVALQQFWIDSQSA